MCGTAEAQAKIHGAIARILSDFCPPPLAELRRGKQITFRAAAFAGLRRAKEQSNVCHSQSSTLDFPPSFVLNRLDWKQMSMETDESPKIDNGAGGSRATKTGKPERVRESGDEPINLILGEIQVLLAEKRTELLNANTVACSAS